MNSDTEVKNAHIRIDELEREVNLLREKMSNQYNATEDLMRRVSKLERGSDGGQFVPTRSIMG